MAQRDVLKYLEDQRASGNDKYFTVKEVIKGLKEKGLGNGTIAGVPNDLFKLAIFSQVEWVGRGIWHHQKLFRAKKPVIPIVKN